MQADRGAPSASSTPPHGGPPKPELVQIRREEPRNMAALILHAVVTRVGWIFKTESVIIPAFLDSIAGAGWLRGLLPVLNRLGQSLPPFFLSRRITVAPRKKNVLLLASLAMAAPFLALAAGVWLLDPEPRSGYAPAFLVLYTLFFCGTGLSMLSAGTLQGKLIRANRRGRLLALATFGGSLPAILFAWWLLPGWLEQGAHGYAKIFAFAGGCFALAAAAALLIREPADARQEPAASAVEQLRNAREILRRDADYRRLVVVGALFSTSLILIPHYQSLGRARLGLSGADLMFWVVTQNVAVGLASVLFGPLADRYGNRLTLRIVIFATALVPPLALALSHLEPALGRSLYTLVFVAIGLLPIGFRLTSNYILEIAPQSEHPRYLSLSQVCTAAVILSSPLFGLMVDLAGYEWVFLSVTALVLTGGLLTFGLVEPRNLRR